MIRNPIDVVTVSKIQKLLDPFIEPISRTQNYVPDWEKHVSKESLLSLFGEDVPKNKTANLKRLTNYVQLSDVMLKLVKSYYPDCQVKCSGHFHYPKTGFMGWHTNHDNPHERVYIAYASEDNKSFFRYYENKRIITDYDNKGITVRKFKVTGERPYFWHCVGSECDRISFGYTLNRDKNYG